MSDDAPRPAFLDYRPVPLAFGTSGLRGLVRDITDLEAYVQVKGALRHLVATAEVAAGSTVPLGGDLRPSTARILGACARAIVDCGCAVEYAGLLPTPALLNHALASGQGSVMVSGSHIPFDRNGIKLGKRGGELLKTDEAPIQAGVARVRAEEYARSAEGSAFDRHGMLKQAPALPPVSPAATERYVARYVAALPEGALRSLRVLVYQHSAVGRELLPRILTELGATVVTAGRSDTFVAIDTENVTDDQVAAIAVLVEAAEQAGQRLDAVVSTDGDSDRPMVLAVNPPGETPRLRFLPGDLLGLVVAEHLNADAAVVPISANDAVARRMAERGAVLRRSRIGSPWVIAEMDRLRTETGARRIVGWEANGGFLTATDVPLGRGVLAALPTRDATLPIVINLRAALEAQLSLGALWDRLPWRFTAAGLLDNVPAEVGRGLSALLSPEGTTTEAVFAADGGVLAASAAGEAGLPLGGEAALAFGAARDRLATVFSAAAGFAPIERINVLDGVRAHFRGGDVAHIRPSGNAPQLRIYANCDSEARARRIVEQSLAEPDGLLRQLERLATAPR